MKINTLSYFIFSLLLMVTSGVGRADILLSTVDDGEVRKGSAGTVIDNGVGEDLMVRSDNDAGNNNVRKAYFKFDLTGQNADLTQSATFTATVSYRFANQNGNRIFYFYGLDSEFSPTGSELGTDWDETALTWDNAPANDTVTNIDTGFDSTASLILEEDNQYNTAVGDIYSVTIPTLGDFVQADNTVTLMISWSDTTQYGFGSKENTTEAYRPTLQVSQIPEPASLALLLIGLAGVLYCRRR